MEKLLLIDGNSMLFRGYYATVYGQSMSTSTGIPTNAIYGFALMLQKAIKTIEPDYILVAFDHDKGTYRHKEYPEYKGTRSATPEDLKIQFPIIREYLDALHITHYECSGLEADDIIGSLAKQNKKYDVNILTSDKDLLQLVDDDIKVYLMHKGISDIVKMNVEAVYERFTLSPLQIIDMKALAGDPSDNIPGVRKIGDKTAIDLLQKYQNVENLYEHIDDITKPKLKENLITDKEMAFLSKRLATIITDAPITIDLKNCAYQKEGIDAYNFYSKYEMRSLASKVDLKGAVIKEDNDKAKQQFVEKKFVIVHKITEDDLSVPTALYFNNDLQIVSLVNEKLAINMSFIDFFASKEIRTYLNSQTIKIVYDLKSWYHLFEKNEYTITGPIEDLMIMAFLVDSKVKNVHDLLNKYSLPIEAKENVQMDLFASDDKNDNGAIASRLFYLEKLVKDSLKEKEMEELYYQVELPLVEVLASLESTGIKVDGNVLDEIAASTQEKIKIHEANIYKLANKTFNINSPKQLAEVIYDDLKLAKSTKRSTDAKYLAKLEPLHPIISEVLEYRKYAKLYSTYAFGLKKYIQPDQKIHSLFNQCVTETGRLSSSEPNLQNISIRNEEASLIRKAFIPDDGCILVGADYSQVELRMLAHMADEEALIQAFKDGYDIHTKTAMDIFGVAKDDVTPLMRRQAKAINFGIDYGMSAYGLSETLQIPVYMANNFIESYYRQYPKIRQFMEKTIEFCQENGYVKTLMNRRREIPEINSSNHNMKEFGKRAAMNAPVQGSAADLIKIAMINVYKELKERNLKSRIVLQIHDELILNVYKEEEEIVKELVERQMENAMELKVPLVAKASSGNNWLEVK